MIVVQLTLTENSEEEELMLVFSRFDKNKDDAIDYTDLFLVFQELNMEVDEEECKDIIYCIDTSGDFKIDFIEFIEAMMYDT